MADTYTPSALQAVKWSAEFFKYGLQNMFFGDFIGDPASIEDHEGRPSEVQIGTDPNALIQMKMDLAAGPGGSVVFPQLAPLAGKGRAYLTTDTTSMTLEGNEEAISAYSWTATLKEWAHAVRDEGPLTRRLAAFDWDPATRKALGLWFGVNMDAMTYAAMAGLAFTTDNSKALVAQRTPSATRKITGGCKAGTVTIHTTDAALDSEEYMCLEIISKARQKAKAAEPIIRPIRSGGRDWYYMFISPRQAWDLKNNVGVSTGPTWDSAQKYASERGSDNPLFTKALGAWDGVMLFEYDKIASRTGAGGSTAPEVFETADPVSIGTTAHRAVLCGASAVVHAYGSQPKFVGKRFDFDRLNGQSVQTQISVEAPYFNSVDYGKMVVDTAVSVASGT